jgi:hypothetical protein
MPDSEDGGWLRHRRAMISAGSEHLTLGTGRTAEVPREFAGTGVDQWARRSYQRREAARRSRRDKGSHAMTRYLISFDDDAMNHIPEKEMPDVANAAHALIQDALDAGVYVFAGGMDFQRPTIVATDGTVTDGPLPQTKDLSGGFTIIDVPTREAALEWAARIAVACRCAQEVREFGPDPELDAMLRQADSRRRRPDDV